MIKQQQLFKVDLFGEALMLSKDDGWFGLPAVLIMI